MDGATVERCVEQLARELCQSGTVAQSTKKRMLANLAKDDKNASLQSDLASAVASLSQASPAPQRFQEHYKQVHRARPKESEQFVKLLAKIAKSQQMCTDLSSSSSRRVSNSGLPRGPSKSATAAQQSQPLQGPNDGNPSPMRAFDTNSSHLDSGLSLESPAFGGGMYSPAPGSTPQQQNGSRNTDPSAHANPLFRPGSDAATPGSMRRPDYPPAMQHAMHLPSRVQMYSDPHVTLPDAGNLFSPMPTVVADAAPAHLQDIVRARAMPAWNVERPFLTGDFLLQAAQSAHRNPPAVSLADKSEDEKEVLLVDDLLYVFLGLEGQYFHIREALGAGGSMHLVYCIAPQCSTCSEYVHEQLHRLLPIAECVVLLERYVESRLAFEFGTVCHAFAAALRVVLDDWKLMVAQLEHQMLAGKGTLQALWFYCQPALVVLELAASLCAEASAQRMTGRALLDHLHTRASQLAGDAVACRLVQRLLHAATVPYFEILTKWVSEGVLEDPYEEFMVVEDAGVSVEADRDGLAAFWSHRHAMRPRLLAPGPDDPEFEVPSFLHAHAQYVLAAGKYLNVLRTCGKSVQHPLDSTQIIDYDQHGAYLSSIHAYYRRASAALLDMMLNDFKLVTWLNSIKHFFFLDKGDFLNSFLDNADDELHKVAYQASQPRLRSLLELSIRTSSLSSDPHHEQLELALEPVQFSELHREVFPKKKDSRREDQEPVNWEARRSLKAVELLMLSFTAEWPLNIVVPPVMMRKYQLIFKHLITLRYVERSLSQTWQRLQKSRQLRLRRAAPEDKRASDVLRRADLLSHRMMFFVQRYLHYMTLEVLEPQWHEMLCAIASASSVDEVIQLHATCLQRVLQWCLLSRLKLLSEVSAIMYTARSFCELIQYGMAVHAEAAQSESSSHHRTSNVGAAPKDPGLESIRAMAADPTFSQDLALLESRFNKANNKLVAQLKTQKLSIMTSADVAFNGDALREEAYMIDNFVTQISFQEQR